MDRPAVQRWLDAYVAAWKSYDPAAIGALFAEDATYSYHPYDQPLHGRDAIVASWTAADHRDPPGSFDAHYEPLLIEGDRAVTHGRSRYFQADGATLKTEFDNIFILRFTPTGQCAEFSEWFMERR